MTNTLFAPPNLPPVLEYARHTLKVHELIAQGKGDSEEAEALADLCDGPWYAMTEQEQDRMRGLIVDLYTFYERKQKRVEMSLDELTKWQHSAQQAYASLESGDVDAALRFLRQPVPSKLPDFVVPFLQAKCWERLGDMETAAVFMKAAERMDAGHAIYILPLLSGLDRLEDRRNGSHKRSAEPLITS